LHIALVHDYLNQYGGAERVLEALHDLYPAAPVYTSLYDRARMPAAFRGWDVRTSFLQRLPAHVRIARAYLPWYPRAFASFDLRGYDLVLSSSSAFAKGVVPPAGTRHICYCHNPARFLWNTAGYMQSEGLGRLPQVLLGPTLERMRRWDLAANERVHAFVANSQTVAGRIRRCYGRESTVIHPPARVSTFPLAQGPGSYLLTGGRLVPHKRFDVAVAACTRLGLPLRVFGAGRDRARLERLAGPTVSFLGRVSEADLRALYRDCRAYLFPSEEDFGISPVEAMACGRPVIAFAAGGALETVADGRTGLFFERQDADALIATLASFRAEAFDPQEIRRHAEAFDVPRFQEQVRTLISSQLSGSAG
jgi:glycosyltransferase involved in cell wall biosynthesis